jgi:hypothetical protein
MVKLEPLEDIAEIPNAEIRHILMLFLAGTAQAIDLNGDLIRDPVDAPTWCSIEPIYKQRKIIVEWLERTTVPEVQELANALRQLWGKINKQNKVYYKKRGELQLRKYLKLNTIVKPRPDPDLEVEK